MPLSFAPMGEETIITRVTGKPETRRHLEDLGLVSGARVIPISQIGGNLILGVKGSRLAISREMAQKIIVNP